MVVLRRVRYVVSKRRRIFVRPRLSANLDVLRAIAVLLVLAQHLCKRMYVDRIGWIPTSSLGHFGVLLFFVHTSLVLMYSMDRSGPTGPSLLKNFYIRRIFRIYPLSILTVLVAFLLHLRFGRERRCPPFVWAASGESLPH